MELIIIYLFVFYICFRVFNVQVVDVIVKMYTYETRRVVVTHSLGVTEGFKYRVSLYDLVFQGALLLSVGVLLRGSTHGGEVRDYLLRVLSFSGTRLTAVGLWSFVRSCGKDSMIYIEF